jgi:hypothetical protein
MARSRLILVAVSLVTVVGTAGPATAATNDDATALHSAGTALAQLEHEQALEQAAALEDAPEVPEIGSGAQALSVLAGPELDARQASAVLADVPEPLEPGVERLLVGTAQAQLLVDHGLAEAGMEDVSEEQVHRWLAAGDAWTGLAQHQATGEEAELAAEPAPAVPDNRISKVDRAPFVLADAVLTDAILDAEPMLTAGASELAIDATEPASHGAAPGDLVDERPYLIVSGEADHHYAPGDDAVLIVDVGGNDDYDNAQGSPFADGSAEVIADLQGDDTYVDTAEGNGAQVSLTTQGAGVAGVGGLLDAGGDDVFRATTDYLPSDSAVDTSTLAQGAGSLGAGALVVQGGQDCLTAESRSLGGTASVIAQGAGTAGAGSAVFQAEPTAGCAPAPSIDATSVPRVVTDTADSFQAELGPALVVGQGASELGAGTFVGGTQDQAYQASADGGLARTVAQGAALTGLGLLADAGGSDDYHADAIGEAELSIALSGYYGYVSSTAAINLGDTETIAQGGAASGAGGLVDAGPGSDSYDAVTSMFASATAKSETTYSSGTTEAQATVDLGETQALGHGGTLTGAALHADASAPAAAAGHDSYRLAANLDAHTTAVAEGGASNTATASTTTEDAAARGLGQAGVGGAAKADVGGDDAYQLSADLDATADAQVSPSGSTSETLDTGEERTNGPAEGSTGAGVFADVGGSDTYATDPGSTQAGDDRCWSNSGSSTDWGIGADVGAAPPAPDCVPP